jgi:hypothetical protein
MITDEIGAFFGIHLVDGNQILPHPTAEMPGPYSSASKV